MDFSAKLAATDSTRPGACRSTRYWIALLLIAVFANLGICVSEHRHAAPQDGIAVLDSGDGGAPVGGARLAEGCSICSAVAACAMLAGTAVVSEVPLALSPLPACEACTRTGLRAIALPDSRAPPLA